jgi:RNA polymerase sigma-70 factor (ECF subfamily)
MLRNHVDAEDAAQEVFLQLFRKVHTFRGESRFSTWLHRLTTNCVLMEMRRKRRRWLETSPEDAPLAMSDVDVGPEGWLDNLRAPAVPIFDRITLAAALAQLPRGFQRIFKMHDVEGYTHAEIAESLYIQIGTSKSQLHKARLRLRRLLQTNKGSTEIQ